MAARGTDAADHPQPPATTTTTTTTPTTTTATTTTTTTTLATLPATAHEPERGIFVELTDQPLDAAAHLQRTRRPSAGANVLFVGTTRDACGGDGSGGAGGGGGGYARVARLAYSAYVPMALRTLRDVALRARAAHADVRAVSIAHRLGDVPVGEESVVVAVSSGHREAGWRAAEAVLEEVKRRAEIWKEEVFEAADGGEARVWRANKDTGPDGAPLGGAGRHSAELS